MASGRKALTIAIKGYLRTSSRMRAISSSRFPAQTSRISCTLLCCEAKGEHAGGKAEGLGWWERE